MKSASKNRLLTMFITLGVLIMAVTVLARITRTSDNKVLPYTTATTAPDLTAQVKVNLAGDFMLHTPLNKAAKTGDRTYDYTLFVEELRPYIQAGDLNITDIEGTVDAYGDNKDISSYPLFNYPIELLDALNHLGFSFVITANNHAYDKGWSGLLKMKENLTTAGLDHTGTNTTQEEYDTYKIKEINGIKIGIVAWSALDNGMASAVGDHATYAMRKFNQDKLDNLPQMIQDAQNLRAQGAEVVLMALHWGAEYQNSPSDNQRQIAKELLEGGVDVLIGNHTHCVQPIEVHTVERDGQPRKALCVYSLGNFFADQIDLSTPIPKTQYGMLVSFEINRDSDGNITLDAMKYMPTFCYRDSKLPSHGASYGYTLAPAGKYARLPAKPDYISDKTWNEAKNSWDHVRAVAGADVEAYDGN